MASRFEMRVFAVRVATRFARREGIPDSSLRAAIDRAERGLVDAELGGGLIKQRVPRPGRGRSGGYRMIVAYRVADRAVFLFGFAKNERENIDARELALLRETGARWLAADERLLEAALDDERLREIGDET